MGRVLNTLQEWAEFYKELRVWVYPFNDYYESFEWKNWRNTEEQGYEDEFKTYNWNAAKGINIVTGKKGVIVLRFPKDEDIRYANNSLSNVLSVLGLPHDYDWVIESETTLSVLIDVCNMPAGRIQRRYKDLEIVYENAFILPPGIENYVCWFKNGLPRKHPLQLSWSVLTEKINEINKRSLVFRGYTKEQKWQATKMKLVAGCALIIVIGVITGILAISSSVSFETWCYMFIGTLVVAIGLIYMMSH